jgi:Tol biopolymer transport system component
MVAGCGSGSAPRPAAEPGGERIVFSKEVGSSFQLFTVAPDGTRQRQITHGAGDSVQADWSPDGSRIVFEYDRPNEDGCGVILINADGSGRKDLSGADQPCDTQPAFTPDGRRVVFVRYDDKADKESIQSMDLTGGDVRVIGGRLGDTDPNVSPDGRTITFVRTPKQHIRQALFAMAIDGSRLRQLTPYSYEVALKHDWSPDGRRIALTTNADWVRRGSSANLVTIRPDGSGLARLTHFTGGPMRGDNAFTGSYSPDGKRIALRVERNEIGGLAVMDADGRHLHRITRRSVGKPRFIDWGD